jgi:hypothetical protein
MVDIILHMVITWKMGGLSGRQQMPQSRASVLSKVTSSSAAAARVDAGPIVST